MGRICNLYKNSIFVKIKVKDKIFVFLDEWDHLGSDVLFGWESIKFVNYKGIRIIQGSRGQD